MLASADKKTIGKNGEDRCAKFLTEHGFSVLERNWRTKRGEIDIIAEKDNILVFVEVKTLPCGNAELLAHVLDKRKQKRISETAKCFIANNRKYNDRIIRFDVIVVDMPGFPSVYHIQNAFLGL